jgi:hypothetical protein
LPSLALPIPIEFRSLNSARQLIPGTRTKSIGDSAIGTCAISARKKYSSAETKVIQIIYWYVEFISTVSSN